jgi:hypothetical protein
VDLDPTDLDEVCSCSVGAAIARVRLCAADAAEAALAAGNHVRARRLTVAWQRLRRALHEHDVAEIGAV